MIFPIYLLIDRSYSMLGEAMESLKVALDNMVSAIRLDAQLSNAARISIYVFDDDVTELYPLTPINHVNLSSIGLQSRGYESNFGKALHLLYNNINQVKKETEQSPPMLIVMTDGHLSDLILYEEMTEKLKRHKFSSITTCLAGHQSDHGFMRLLSDQIYQLDEADINTFIHIFESSFYGHQKEESGNLSDDLPSEIIIL